MEQILIIGVIGIVAVVFVTSLAPRFGVAAPLMLVLLGIGVSLLPFVKPIEIDPEWVLGGMLPLLLYSTAVNTPLMEFRRDLPTISLFAVLLVVASAVSVGFLLVWLVPSLPLGVGIAVGAIVSPTDAVATTIVRQSGASQRIVTVLEGEALFNDASALVLLRSAIAAVSASFSFWHITLDFVYAVVVAIGIGLAVGYINLAVRRRIAQVASNVAFSLVVPFLAFLPAEHLGASGLVAAVVAGLITGDHTAKHLPSEVRITERAVWRTIELLLESAIFLLMGLQLFALHEDAVITHQNEWLALGLGAAAATVVIVIRSVFVAGAVHLLSRRTQRLGERQERITLLQEWLEEADSTSVAPVPRLVAPAAAFVATTARMGRESGTYRRGRLRKLLEKQQADLDYLAAEQFGWKDGAILVVAGMRGAITLAAAQSLPLSTPHRSLLILTAFVVAAGTLLIQGGTLALLVKALKLSPRDPSADAELTSALRVQLNRAALSELDAGQWRRKDGSAYSAESVHAARKLMETALRVGEQTNTAAESVEAVELRLEIIEAQRSELLRIRDLGTFPSGLLETKLMQLDAEQLGVELRLRQD
ncbi:MAG: sodium:proton antiporter [Propionibacteriaceae bacterium]|jgi:CPA1 family monovalent cation:H+ antiporter|nr:sodium:proton antiporter [Propionibacteriaceae bacterium]